MRHLKVTVIVMTVACVLGLCAHVGAADSTTAPKGGPKYGVEAWNRYLTMMGGLRALDSVRSVFVQGKRISSGVTSRFELRARRTGEFVLTIQAPNGSVRRFGCGTDGKGWTEDGGTVQDLTGAALEERRLMIIPYLPLADFKGKALLPKLECHPGKEGELAVGSGGGARFPRMVFEPGTWRLRRLGRYSFRDFRFTEGIVVPHTIRDGAVVYQAASVQFVQPMADSVFARPPAPPPPRLVQPD